MKTFSTSGTGNQQTLSEIESDKMPIYATDADAESDLANLAEGQIIATLDTGDELSHPVDVVESGNLHAVTSNAVSESLSYSTDEELTGGKWIDEKPIYRKVIDCGALPNNTTKQVAHNISNVDRFIRYYGTARANSGTTLDIPYLDNNGYDYSVFVNLNNTNISVITKADRSAYVSTYIILEYTKTTV